MKVSVIDHLTHFLAAYYDLTPGYFRRIAPVVRGISALHQHNGDEELISSLGQRSPFSEIEPKKYNIWATLLRPDIVLPLRWYSQLLVGEHSATVKV